MFRVKVCGVTRPEDARHAVAAGADAVGLNFYAPSPRSVDSDHAERVARAATGALRIGVFVDAPRERIVDLVGRVPLEGVQLHGDEPVESVLALPAGIAVVRAFRMGPEGLGPIADYARRCSAAGRPLAAVLVDAPATMPGEYGGTGRQADWSVLARERGLMAGTPLVLAGGLRPDNVAQAVSATGCDAVDTASGVESEPGLKDPRLVEEFVQQALAALRGE